MSNYKFTQTEGELIAENKRLRLQAENQRLKCLFRFACEVLAHNDFELDAYGHKIMIERLYDDTQTEAQ
jgi:hypothetical protein